MHKGQHTHKYKKAIKHKPQESESLRHTNKDATIIDCVGTIILYYIIIHSLIPIFFWP